MSLTQIPQLCPFALRYRRVNGQIAVVKEAFNGDFVNSLFNAFLARIVLKGKFPLSIILFVLLNTYE